MIKSVFIIMVAVLVSSLWGDGRGVAQNIDSLWAIYNNKTQPDTNRLKALQIIAWNLRNNNPDTAIILAEQEVQLAQQSKQKKLAPNLFRRYEAMAFIIMGQSHVNKGNYPKALEYYLQSLQINEEIGYKRGIGNCYNNIGAAYHNQSNYPKALEYNLKSLKIKQETGDKKGVGTCYNNIGFVYYYQSNYPKALE